MPEKWILQQYQALPLIAKVRMTQNRIREWYNHYEGNVYVSFTRRYRVSPGKWVRSS